MQSLQLLYSIKPGDPVIFAEKYKLVDEGVYESKKVDGSHVTFKD